MSLKSAPYYWLECDNCGERAEYDDYSAMSGPDQAITLAVDSDWTENGDRHHCPDCPDLVTVPGGQPAPTPHPTATPATAHPNPPPQP